MAVSIQRTAVKDVLANMVTLELTEVTVDGKGRKLSIDPAMEVEYHTDKDAVKIVPCRNEDCKRPMVVTTFFMPDKAVCRSCKGETGTDRTGSLAQVIPGQTDPANAINLADALINKQFTEVICPICVEPMELKNVNHNDNYGPGHWDGKGRWHQDAPGETTLHQCNKCLVTASYSTTARTQFKRQNEVRPGKQVNGWGEILGTREDPKTRLKKREYVNPILQEEEAPA